jgi:malonate decarboxylase beta subunit
VGLNGPAVIEQEAGIAEYDSRDKPFIWSFTGGEQRYRSGLADAYVEDDSEQMRATVRDLILRGMPAKNRSERYQEFLACLDQVDASLQATPEMVRGIYRKGFSS